MVLQVNHENVSSKAQEKATYNYPGLKTNLCSQSFQVCMSIALEENKAGGSIWMNWILRAHPTEQYAPNTGEGTMVAS